MKRMIVVAAVMMCGAAARAKIAALAGKPTQVCRNIAEFALIAE